jgi:hypothetical protein
MRSKSKTKAEQFILGEEAFAQISAVEGIVFTPEMDDMFRDFDRDGVSPEDRRRALIRRYGNKS